MSWLAGMLDRGRLHAVDGSVFCPYRGADINLEQCYSCSRFLRTGVDRTGAWIRCRPDGHQAAGSGPTFPLGGR